MRKSYRSNNTVSVTQLVEVGEIEVSVDVELDDVMQEADMSTVLELLINQHGEDEVLKAVVESADTDEALKAVLAKADVEDIINAMADVDTNALLDVVMQRLGLSGIVDELAAKFSAFAVMHHAAQGATVSECVEAATDAHGLYAVTSRVLEQHALDEVLTVLGTMHGSDRMREASHDAYGVKEGESVAHLTAYIYRKDASCLEMVRVASHMWGLDEVARCLVELHGAPFLLNHIMRNVDGINETVGEVARQVDLTRVGAITRGQVYRSSELFLALAGVCATSLLRA